MVQWTISSDERAELGRGAGENPGRLPRFALWLAEKSRPSAGVVLASPVAIPVAFSPKQQESGITTDFPRDVTIPAKKAWPQLDTIPQMQSSPLFPAWG